MNDKAKKEGQKGKTSSSRAAFPSYLYI